MGDRAGIGIRVSSGGQDEASQLPDVERHCRANGYDVAKPYVLHDKSASKGEHEPMLAEMLADMAAGEITVLVAWQSSRLDRQGTKRGYAAAVGLAGGWIEITQEPEFGGNGLGDEIMTTVRMVNSQVESRTKSERVRIAFDTIDANGAWRGKPPWGLVAEGPSRGKHLVPTAAGAEYVPQIYVRVTGNRARASPRSAARWLESEGVSPAGITSAENNHGKTGRWWPRSLGLLIRNPAYMGRAIVRMPGPSRRTCARPWSTRTPGRWRARHWTPGLPGARC